jgi:TPP-dependent pyruvate/acetoin dehydrogenase alpha subunit
MYDPELYRTKAEVAEWKRRDPIPALAARLHEEDPTADEAVAALEREVAERIDEAVAFAERGTLEPVDQLARFVVSERPG